jgi:raffinose/stachyose/melibiose transport system permease protein
MSSMSSPAQDSSPAPRRRARGRGPGEASWPALLFILPALALYVAFTIVPLGQAAWLSLFSWDGITSTRWVGFSNYRTIIDDPNVRAAFWHPFVLIIFYSFIPIALGLGLAGIFQRARIRGMAVFRLLLFTPQVIAPLAVAVVWKRIYELDGPLNTLLRQIGLGGLTRAWLGDFTWALSAVGLIGTWLSFGFCLLLFLAGVQKIPTALYEAARMDGAGPVQEFFAVTLPGLRREIFVALILTIIAALQTFDIIYLLTSGGPGYSTSVPSYAIYHEAFQLGEVGKAAAYGVTLTVMITLVVLGIVLLDRGADEVLEG